MRCTTELTARFSLNLNLIGSMEIEEALEPRYNDYLDTMWVDAPSIAVQNAMDLEELNRIERETGLDDALDFETVPFEEVEADLSVELYEQDLAEDREYDHGNCECAQCGLSDDWDDGLLTLIAGKFYCAKCKPAQPKIKILEELYQKRAKVERERRYERARRFRAALTKAKELRPDLSWGAYEYDVRMYA